MASVIKFVALLTGIFLLPGGSIMVGVILWRLIRGETSPEEFEILDFLRYGSYPPYKMIKSAFTEFRPRRLKGTAFLFYIIRLQQRNLISLEKGDRYRITDAGRSALSHAVQSKTYQSIPFLSKKELLSC